MDIVFNCPECGQQLEVDQAAGGSQIDCPTCGKPILIPRDEAAPVLTEPPMAKTAEAKIERHFKVPQHEKKEEELIQKPPPPLEVAAKETDRKIRVKSIKRGDCQEVGKDRFDDTVTTFISKIGESNVVSIHPINYSHIDLETRALVTDYGVIVVYKG